MAERTLPTAGVAPIDAYVINGGDRNAGYFACRQEVASASAWPTAVQARFEVDNTVGGAVGIQVTASIEDGANIGSIYGIWVEMPTVNASATVSNYYAMSIRMKGDAVSAYQSLFRLYNSATAATPAIDSVFHLANSGGTPFTYLFQFDGQVAPVASAVGESLTVSHKIKVKVAGSDYYIHVGTSG